MHWYTGVYTRDAKCAFASSASLNSVNILYKLSFLISMTRIYTH